MDVLALTGLPVGIPVRYFLLGDDEQAQRKLVQAKQRPAAGVLVGENLIPSTAELYCNCPHCFIL